MVGSRDSRIPPTAGANGHEPRKRRSTGCQGSRVPPTDTKKEGRHRRQDAGTRSATARKDSISSTNAMVGADEPSTRGSNLACDALPCSTQCQGMLLNKHAQELSPRRGPRYKLIRFLFAGLDALIKKGQTWWLIGTAKTKGSVFPNSRSKVCVSQSGTKRISASMWRSRTPMTIQLNLSGPVTSLGDVCFTHDAR